MTGGTNPRCREVARLANDGCLPAGRLRNTCVASICVNRGGRANRLPACPSRSFRSSNRSRGTSRSALGCALLRRRKLGVRRGCDQGNHCERETGGAFERKHWLHQLESGMRSTSDLIAYRSPARNAEVWCHPPGFIEHVYRRGRSAANYLVHQGYRPERSRS
ncbi:hypothetical protein Poly41_61480 [Novipirellula artificiosorum]|uniref:Uncharacterized protein n=1 Tax=Novipirellula artificiosorum TaxID=2528016 RepID=A0A5C6D7C1_9BACT|nr:hypothetical protein Poly41_61480 [Novipirellula artificiosorum]